MSGVKFSQFRTGGDVTWGDQFVGLRAGVNTIFDVGNIKGGSLVDLITQNAHGFLQDQVVYFNGANYALAKADTSADAEVIGVVTEVLSVNQFEITTSGSLVTLAALTPGSVYFLSDTVAGELTLTEPSTVGSISKPLVIAVGTHSGYFTNFRGKIIPAPVVPPVPVPFTWNVVPFDTQMVVNEGYITTDAGLCVLVLPVLAAAGDVIRVAGYGAGGWSIAQNAGQSILFNDIFTTPGVSGSVASTARGNTVELVCVIANTTFTLSGAPLGIITVV